MEKQMRIVAMNSQKITIQTRLINGHHMTDWKQGSLTEMEFIDFMQFYFNSYWKEYELGKQFKPVFDHFYYYGATPEMIRRGESYIFRSIL